MRPDTITVELTLPEMRALARAASLVWSTAEPVVGHRIGVPAMAEAVGVLMAAAERAGHDLDVLVVA